ncbi:MAG: hypothetical protein BalsKO_11370 [Balneolaceae bacterium]
MIYSEINKRLENFSRIRSDFDYEIAEGLSSDEIHHVEKTLNISFPSTIVKLLSHIDGLKINNPEFILFEAKKWEIDDSKLMNFAQFKDSIDIAFDTNLNNSSGQWDIMNVQNNYVLTLTIESFLSNKIWHWIENRREIWKDKFWED